MKKYRKYLEWLQLQQQHETVRGSQKRGISDVDMNDDMVSLQDNQGLNSSNPSYMYKRLSIQSTGSFSATSGNGYSKIERWFDRMSKKEAADFDEAIAFGWYSAGLPFSAIENTHIRKAFGKLRPAYCPPTRKQLAGKLLDMVHAQIKVRVDQAISKAEHVTIATDGTTSINKESVLNYMVMTPKPYFIERQNTGDDRHTAEYIAAEIAKIIQSIGPKKGIYSKI